MRVERMRAAKSIVECYTSATCTYRRCIRFLINLIKLIIATKKLRTSQSTT